MHNRYALKYSLQELQKYAPGFGGLGISRNFVVAAAMWFVRSMMPHCTSAVSIETYTS